MHIGVIVLVLFAWVEVAKSTATINIKFIHYNNPYHRMSNSRCCEQGIEPICRKYTGGKRCENCTLECDNLFHISLTKFKGGGTTPKDTLLFVNTTVLAYKDTFYFPSNLSSVALNPLKKRIDKYEGLYQLEVSSFDDDEHRGIDYVDSSRMTFNMINIPSFLHDERKDIGVFMMTGNVSFVNISIWVQCDRNFYTSTCDVFCKQLDDANGHYDCNRTTGQKICLPGWLNGTTNCTTRDSSFSSSILTQASSSLQILLKTSSRIAHTPLVLTPTTTIDNYLVSTFSSMTVLLSAQTQTTLLSVNTITDNYLVSTSLSMKVPLSVQPQATASLSVTTMTTNAMSSIIRGVLSTSTAPTRHSSTTTVSSSTVVVDVEKCWKTKHTLDVTLKGEFESNKNLNQILQNVFCVVLNSRCFGSESSATCPTTEDATAIRSKDVWLQNITSNATFYHAQVVLSEGHIPCSMPRISVCAEEALLSTNIFSELLNVKHFEMCSSNGKQCKSKHFQNLPGDGNDDGDGTNHLAVIIVCCVGAGLVFAAAATTVYLLRKKREMKIGHMEDSNSIVSNCSREESNTSSC